MVTFNYYLYSNLYYLPLSTVVNDPCIWAFKVGGFRFSESGRDSTRQLRWMACAMTCPKWLFSLRPNWFLTVFCMCKKLVFNMVLICPSCFLFFMCKNHDSRHNWPKMLKWHSRLHQLQLEVGSAASRWGTGLPGLSPPVGRWGVIHRWSNQLRPRWRRLRPRLPAVAPDVTPRPQLSTAHSWVGDNNE